MKIKDARNRLIVMSLIITGAQMVFFIAAPSFGYPLSYSKSFGLVQLTGPVFVGYLGSATRFVFKPPSTTIAVHEEHLGVLVNGAFILYSLLVGTLLFTFAYSNRVGVAIGSGMSTETLSLLFSVLLGFLAASTGIAVSNLFPSEAK